MRNITAWMVAGGLFLSGNMAQATFPLTTDEADTQDPGTFQIEAGSSYETDPECHHYDIPVSLTYGIMPQWDVAAGFGGQFEQRAQHEEECDDRRVSGLADLNLSTKWMFLKESAYLPRQTMCPSVTLPTADKRKGLGSGETDYDLTWMASKAIGDQMGLHLNLGYAWLGDPATDDVGDVIHGGWAVDYQMTETLQWIGEVVGENELENDEMAWQGRAGLRWEFMSDFMLVAAAGSRLSGDAPDFMATAGLIWVFGFDGDNENK